MSDTESAQVTADQISHITISTPPNPPTGTNVAITFHVTEARVRATPLPPRLSVGINGKSVDAYDMTGVGTYTVYAKGGGAIPATPLFLKGGQGPRLTAGESEKIKLSCKTVPCPPDCRSTLFGSACVVCVQCEFELSLEID